MNTAEFIAKHNADGVVAFAKENGYNISNKPEQAYDFLKQAWDSDPEAVRGAMKKLHPHAEFLGGVTNVDEHNFRKIKRSRFRNFDASEYEDEGRDVMDILERGINKGKEMVGSIMNGQGNGQSQKDHTKEILTYGAVLLAGIFIGKYLMK